MAEAVAHVPKFPIEVIDWYGRSYKVNVFAIPNKGDDLQIGYADDKRVRGIVSRVERTIGEFGASICVYISDNEDVLNDDSSFEETHWWHP